LSIYFDHLLLLLPLLYFRELEDRKLSAVEMKAEVESHMKKKVAIESVLPTNIMIGPFSVNTDGIRQGVAKKHRSLATAVLELLAKKLRMQAEEVSSSTYLLTYEIRNSVFSWP